MQFMTNEPNIIPQIALGPKMINSAKQIPDGGQTGEAPLGWNEK